MRYVLVILICWIWILPPLLLLPPKAEALVAVTVQWDVQGSSCSDTNGGGFNVNSAGVDRSQSAAPFVNINNSTVIATVNASTITFTGGYTATSADVGNVVNIISSTGGTAPTAGRYEITGQTSTTWTLDRTTGALTSTLTSALMGGCLATIQQAVTNTTATGAPASPDMTIWVKTSGGPYNLTSALALSPAATGSYNAHLVGYNTTHNDIPTGANRPVIATNANAINAVNMSGAGWSLENFIVDCSGATKGLIGIHVTALDVKVFNTKVTTCSTYGIDNTTAALLLDQVEITSCTGSTKGAFYPQNTAVMLHSWIHDNAAQSGVYLVDAGQQMVFIGNVISNNAGASSDGITGLPGNSFFLNNVIYGNGRAGMRATLAYGETLNTYIQNNILAKNTSYAFDNTGTPPVIGTIKSPFNQYVDYNATYNNNSTTTQANQYNKYVAGSHDKNVTSDPFTNAAGNDFTLISTGAGATLRAAGNLGVTLNGLGSTGYLDLGAFQHQDGGGSCATQVCSIAH